MATSKARSILPAAREVQLAAQELQLTEAEATQRFSKGLPPGRHQKTMKRGGSIVLQGRTYLTFFVLFSYG